MQVPKALLARGVNAYSPVGEQKKRAFHTVGRKFLLDVAAEIGLPRGSFDVRSNKAGIAVSGEVVLHGEHVYVQLAECAVGSPGISAMYRPCRGRRDYVGGANHFIRMDELNRARLTAWLEVLQDMNVRHI